MFKRAGFFAIVTVTLGLGVGACVSIFSVANAMFFRALPYGEISRLSWVWQQNAIEGWSYLPVSAPNYLDWQQQAHAFEQLAAFRSHWPDLDPTGSESDPPLRLRSGEVTTNLFSILGVKPLLGRTFLPEDERSRVIVLSHGLWQTCFRGDPNTIGQSVRLGGGSYTVVGVMPAGFHFPPEPEPDQLWIPLNIPAGEESRRGLRELHVVGRLRSGANARAAQAELDVIMARLAKLHPVANRNQGAVLHHLRNWWHHPFERIIYVLVGAVGLLLLMSCSNVANLLLVKATGRRHEIALRAALGASRMQIIRLLLRENLLLALSGGLLGVLLAFCGTRLLDATIPLHNYRVGNIHVDGVALIFALTLSLGTTLLFGLAPALASARVSLSLALKEGVRAGESRGPKRLRQVFVVAQVAFAVVLLSGALLVGQQFFQWRQVERGFRPERLLAAEVPLPMVRYTRPIQFVNFHRDLLETLGTMPGLAACTSTDLPLSEGDGLAREFQIEGRPVRSTSSRESMASMEWVSRNYFQVLGISLLRGNGFTEQQSDAGANVAVISRELARKYFPGENPVGQRLRCFAPAYGAQDQGREHLLEIIGVASDVKHGHPSQKPDARIYIPYAQNPSWQLFLAVRTSLEPAEAGRLMRRAVAVVDPRLPIAEIHSMEYLIRNSLADERVQVVLWTLFAVLATALAGIGIYGVLSFAVASGGRDFAVRLALGARRGQVVRAVIMGGLRLAFLGIVAGLVLSWSAWRIVSSQLYVSAPLEPMAALEVTFFVALVTMSACILPACRAANINLSHLLQYE